MVRQTNSSPNLETCNLEDWQRAKTIADVSDSTNFSFHMSEMIADDRKSLRHVGKIETLPIFPIRPRPSQIIGDVYDLWFSSAKSGTVGKLRNPRSSGIFPTYEN